MVGHGRGKSVSSFILSPLSFKKGWATVILRDAGFPRVANLHGGMHCGSRWGCRYCAAQAPYLNRQHLNGIKPANIPFEEPIKFEFIINLKRRNRSA
jgi:hypothetical protein